MSAKFKLSMWRIDRSTVGQNTWYLAFVFVDFG